MAGTIVADTLQSSITGTPVQFNDGTGTQIGTLCRAFVNFNGTGTVAIRASFNVSSITDNGTGDYTVNFTTAMPDANYAWFGMAKNVDGAANYNYPSVGSRSTTVPATSSIRIGTAFQQASSASDFDYVYVSIFR
jgi:hypothetical protein